MCDKASFKQKQSINIGRRVQWNLVSKCKKTRIFIIYKLLWDT